MKRTLLSLARRSRGFVCRDERGTQLVELALVIPLLLLLLGATAEFGRFMYTYTTLAKATRAGARYVVSQAPGMKDAETAKLVVYGNTAGTGTPVVAGLNTTKIDITRSVVPNGTAVTVRVVNFTYEPIFDLGKMLNLPALTLAVNVGASSTMRQLVL